MSAPPAPDRPGDGALATAGGAAREAAGGAANEAERRAALRAEIERTRAALSETVGALAAKTDVKARAQDKAGEVKTLAQDRASEVYSDVAYWIGRSRERIRMSRGAPWPLLAGLAVLTGLSAAAAALWRGEHRRQRQGPDAAALRRGGHRRPAVRRRGTRSR